MECAIFCLLALCAFKAVFAGHSAKGEEKEYIARDETNAKFFPAFQKMQDNYSKAVDALKPKGAGSDKVDVLMANCLAKVDEDNKSDEKYKTALVQCDESYHKADQDKKIEDAHKSCAKIVANYASTEKVNVDKAVGCVTKCLQPGADCKKMLKAN